MHLSNVKTKISKVVLSAAQNAPASTRFALGVWGRVYLWSHKAPPALFYDAADIVRLQIPVQARLENGMKIKVVWNELIGREIYQMGCYEPKTVELISALLEPGAVFLDCGAHFGEYTLIASRLVGDRGQIHSFEPDPYLFGLLQESVALNGLTNVSLQKTALTDVEGFANFYLGPASFSAGNSLAPQDGPEARICQTRCTTLENYLRSAGLERVDLIKMDVEGAEVKLLNGARTLLEAAEKPIIAFEYNDAALKALGQSGAELLALLAAHGYRVLRIRDIGLQAFETACERQDVCNYLAVPENKAGAVLGMLSAKLAPKRLQEYLEV